MKHFEDLWNEAEEASKQYFDNNQDMIKREIIEDLDDLLLSTDQNDKIEAMGSILLKISYLSEKLNINVYAALKNELDDLKIKLFDPSLEEEYTIKQIIE